MLTLLPWFTLAWTAELVTSRVTVADGLPTSWTTALAQGPDDRMWLGGPGWVARFDGERMRSWSSPGAAGIVVTDLVPLGDDTAAVRLLDGQVLQVSDDLLVPVVGPDGAPLAARDLSAGRDGSLLAVVDGRAWRRDGVGWSPSPGGVVDVEQVAEGRPGELFLGTSDGWHTARDGASTLLVATRDPVDAVVDGDVAWLSAGRPLRVWRVQHGEEPVLVYEDPFDRAYAMAPRDGSLWLSRSTDVVRIDGDGQATTYPGRQLQAHGPVLVDSAGGLWGASFEGALYVPEPGLERWTVESGLATNTTRGALKVGGDPWVPTWNGLHRIGPDGRVWPAGGHGGLLPVASDATIDTPRFARGEVRLVDRIRVVAAPSEDQAEQAAADALALAEQGDCETAETQWIRTKRHRPLDTRWHASLADDAHGALAACWARAAEGSEHPARALARATRWDRRVPELDTIGGPVGDRLWAQGMEARQAGDHEAAYAAFRDLLSFQPWRAWARRYAEEHRDARLGVAGLRERASYE